MKRIIIITGLFFLMNSFAVAQLAQVGKIKANKTKHITRTIKKSSQHKIDSDAKKPILNKKVMVLDRRKIQDIKVIKKD